MLQNELSCLLLLLCASPPLHWSLWTRPKPVASAILSILHREQPLPQELSLLSVWESVCAPCCSARWKRDLGPRCGPGDFFSLLFAVRILRGAMVMFSWSCFDHEEFNLFVSTLDPSLAQGRLPAWTAGIGWCGDFATSSLRLFLSPIFFLALSITSSNSGSTSEIW